MAQAGARRIGVTVGQQADGAVLITVDDDGPGFPPQLLAGALERFGHGSARDFARRWTSGQPGTAPNGTGGAGPGLATVDMVARAHGGTVRVGSDSPLGGARIVVRLAA